MPTADAGKKSGYTGGQALVAALEAHGADIAFGVPGESYLDMLDAFVGADMRFITCRHEAGAANMAEAYGKLTGRPGICCVTRGPGASHAATGLHTAFQDSTPMILFVGQVASDQVDREAFQEIDYRRFFSEVTKWSAEINRADRIGEYVSRAFRVATSGRPGPVVLSLPEDMLTSQTVPQPLPRYTATTAHPGRHDMDRLATMLNAADRPLIMVGGSGWTAGAVADLQDFAGRHHIPVCASFRAQDRFDNDHPCYVGDMGIAANPALTSAMQNSDLLVVIGARLGEMTTGGYDRLTPGVPKVPLIHIHAGAEELGRVYQPQLGIHAAPHNFAPAFTALSLIRSWAPWCKTLRENYTDWQVGTPNPGTVQIADLYKQMRAVLPSDAIFTNGAGNYAGWLHRFMRYRSYPSQLAPTSGAMGYGLPAAIAAKIVHPDREVICLAGDGCFQMSVSDLPTAAQYGANIIVLVFNNGMYGTIRMHQERSYPGRVSATELINPDFVKLAEACGYFAARIEATEAFPDAFAQARSASRPALLEIMVDPEAITPTATLSSLSRP